MRIWPGRQGGFLVAVAAVSGGGGAGVGSSRLPSSKTAVAGDVGGVGVAERMLQRRQLAESLEKMGGGADDERGGRGLL